MSETGEVIALDARGAGVVRHEGKVVFVPGALPGERVRFRIVADKKRFDEAVLEEVLRPAPERRATPCTHDVPGGCGGCALLHAGPRAAAAWKAAQLGEALERAGVAASVVEAPRVPGSGLAYRNHARFFVVEGGRLAYVARREPGARVLRDKLPIDACPVLHPLVEELRAAFDGRAAGASLVELRAAPTTGERLVILDASQPPPVDLRSIPASVALRTKRGLVPLRGLPQLHELVQGVRLRISADSFFQVNTDGALELVRIVRELAGPLGPKSMAADLYAGVGLFALAALRDAGRVVAAESARGSAQDLRENAKGRAGISARFEESADVLDDLASVRDVPEVVVADPPRAGLGGAVTDKLVRLGPPRIVLVSCDPAMLVRDLPAFVRAGFRVERVIPVDQFGGTHHLEAVALLVR